MANVKISQLPVVTSVLNTDVIPVVASNNTSQISITNLANSLSSSYNFASTGSNIFTGPITINSPSTLDLIVTGSSVVLGNLLVTGSIDITGSLRATNGLIVTGSINTLSSLTGSLVFSQASLIVQTTASAASGPLKHYPSIGSFAGSMYDLSGSLGNRIIPTGNKLYYITCNESNNSKTSLFLYDLTSNGTTSTSPMYSEEITIVNTVGSYNAWILPSQRDSATFINTIAGAFTSRSLAAGAYMRLFVEYASFLPQWHIMASGSLF